jgi:signal transduction histidine kinase
MTPGAARLPNRLRFDRRRARLGAIAVLGLSVIAFGVWLPWHSPWPPPDTTQSAQLVVTATVTGLWLVAALVACSRDPTGPLWKILFAFVFADWIWALGFLGTPLAWTVGDAFQNLGTAVFVHALVAFPTGRLANRADRALVAFVYVASIATALLTEMTWDVQFNCDPFCNQNVFFVWKNDAFHDAMRVLNAILVPTVGVLVIAAVLRHWRAAGRAARRALLPAVVALPFAYFANVVAALGDNLDIGWLSELGRLPIVLALNAIVPVGFIIGITRSRLGRGRVADLVTELGHGVPLGGLRDVLARALGDPTLELAFAGADGDFVDGSGRRFEVPSGTVRAVARVERNGECQALLVHDPALDNEDPGLVAAVASAAGLALDNERLAAEVRAQLEEVRASRARIALAADAERRSVERDLHDGAQQRLVALTMRLEQARGTAAGSAALIDAATAELRAAISEVRLLARGLRPPILDEAGLAAAVESLAERTPLPIDVDIPERRFSPAVEAAAYYVIAEALTNVTKYAGASHAVVGATADDATMSVSVADDGRGGADPELGSGLQGLRDRVAAIGGTLVVSSPPGGGTVVTAVIPLAREVT